MRSEEQDHEVATVHDARAVKWDQEMFITRMEALRGWPADKALHHWKKLKSDPANHAGKTNLTTLDEGLVLYIPPGVP